MRKHRLQCTHITHKQVEKQEGNGGNYVRLRMITGEGRNGAQSFI